MARYSLFVLKVSLNTNQPTCCINNVTVILQSCFCANFWSCWWNVAPFEFWSSPWCICCCNKKILIMILHTWYTRYSTRRTVNCLSESESDDHPVTTVARYSIVVLKVPLNIRQTHTCLHRWQSLCAMYAKCCTPISESEYAMAYLLLKVHCLGV